MNQQPNGGADVEFETTFNDGASSFGQETIPKVDLVNGMLIT